MVGTEERELYPPIHPGEILVEEFMEPFELTAYALAQEIGVDAPRIYKIAKGERAITADTALRLSRLFGTTPQFWLNLQARYDLDLAERDAQTYEQIRPIRRLRAPDSEAAQSLESH